MLDTVPIFVGGGAEHSPELIRVLASAATSGAMGIIGAGDLQVRALNVPGTKVRIAPGIGVMPNRYPGGGNQSYIGRNASETLVDVPATTSSGGKAWLVIMRVKDPQYAGAVPADVKNGPYTFLELVACGATDKALPLGTAYPYVPLARINMPASTATVLQSYITPLREMAMPRRRRDLNTLGLTGAQSETQTSTAAGGEQWPNAASWYCEVPEWATQVRVRADWAQVFVPAGQVGGELWVQIGKEVAADTRETQHTQYLTPDSDRNQRSSFICADTINVPATWRGGVRYVTLQAKLSQIYSGGNAARLIANGGSAVVCDLEWLEAPSQDDF